jgi:hypothetical protein
MHVDERRATTSTPASEQHHHQLHLSTTCGKLDGCLLGVANTDDAGDGLQALLRCKRVWRESQREDVVVDVVVDGAAT